MRALKTGFYWATTLAAVMCIAVGVLAVWAVAAGAVMIEDINWWD